MSIDRVTTRAFVAFVVMAGFSPAQETVRYKAAPEQLPREVAPQPVPFDHKLHTAARVTCADCHPGATSKERAGLPRREQCMLCHATIATDKAAVRKLAALPADERIRWERIYQVPDFVFFSHRSHTAAEIQCGQCHGPVQDRRVLAQERSTNMVACMNCHADREVSNECFLCHDLGQ